jgi:tape measure domain-containing protein
MTDIASLLVMIKSTGAKQASTDLDSVKSSGERAEVATKNLTKSTDSLTDTYKNLRNSAVAYASYNAVKSIAKTGLEFDRMTRALVASTGSTQVAKEEMAFLRAEADRIGVSILSVGKSYSQLSAAAKGTNISQSQVRDVFTAVSEAAVVLGLSADDTKGSMRALVQVMSKGKVQAEELRGQIGERFPGAFQAASRAMGMSTEELSDMLEAGNLLSDEFIPKFTAEIRRTYEKAVPEALKSAQAAFGRFETAMANAQNEVAQGGMLDALAVAAKTSSEALTELISGIKEVAEFTAALSVDQISLWEYAAGGAKTYFKTISEIPILKDTSIGMIGGWLYDLGEGTDEVSVKLEKLKNSMANDESGKRIAIVRPAVPAEKGPSRSELKADKRASDKAKKDFAALQDSMLTEEQAMEDSYVKRNRIIYDNTSAGTAFQEKLIARSQAMYGDDLSAFESSKAEELNTLMASLMTEEEVIRDSYKKRMDIVNSSEFSTSSEKSETTARITADRDKQLESLRKGKQEEYLTLVESLRTEEEEILDSYNKRREIILTNAEATATQKADLIRRLDEEFATDALGEFAKPDTFEEELAGIQELYERKHELIMSNTALTAEAKNALEIELERQKNEVIAGMERDRMNNMLESSAQTFGGLAELAKAFKGEQSKEYKAMFATSQAFEIAQAIMKTYDSATGAYSALSSIPYVGPALGAAAAEAAISVGMANVAAIKGQSFSGAYDTGGYIPGGSVGLVGEIGPELVSGPANVTSRKDTAAMLGKPAPAPQVNNNIRIVNAFEPSVVGDYIGSDEGEKAILNIVKRNSQTIKQITG